MKRNKVHMGLLTFVMSTLVFVLAATGAQADEYSVADLAIEQKLSYTQDDSKDAPYEYHYRIEAQDKNCPMPQKNDACDGSITSEGVYSFSLVGNKEVHLAFEPGKVTTSTHDYIIVREAVSTKGKIECSPSRWCVRVLFNNQGQASQIIRFKDDFETGSKYEKVVWDISYTPEKIPDKEGSGFPGGITSKTGDLLYNVVPAATIIFILGLVHIYLGYKNKNTDVSN